MRYRKLTYLDVDTVKYLKTSHLKKIFIGQKDQSAGMCKDVLQEIIP